MKEEKIKKLINLLLEEVKNTDIEEVEIEEGGFKVRIKRFSKERKKIISEGPSKEPSAEGKETEEITLEEGYYIVKSPFVGTFYRAPSPDSSPFVEEGDRVEKGQTLCIVEAMKIMNEVESEVSGKIVKIFPENGSPVEYNQPLFAIEVEEG